MSTAPVKAKIKNLDAKNSEGIECMFNPTEYTFSKRNTWNKSSTKGKNVPQLEFAGGDSMSLKMQLFFDTSINGGDVRKTTNEIWKLVSIDPKLADKKNAKGRPPLVEFMWGTMWSFRAVITDINQKFTLFRSDGTPIRATLDVTFLQAEEEGKYPGQNPTTIGQPGYKSRVVYDADTIDLIAYEEYGDSAMWRYIADVNNLDHPEKLKPGQVLMIAPLP